MNSRPSSASGVVNGIGVSPARGGGGARRTSGRRGSCRTTGRRSSPGAWRRGRRSRPSRPRAAPCRRRCVARSTVTSMPSPVSTSTRRRSPSSGGSSSSGDRTWRTISSEPVAASSRMTLSAAGSSRSEMRITTPRPWSCAPACRAAATRSVGPSAGSIADRSASSRKTRPEPRIAARRRAVRPASALTATRSSLREPDVAERRRRALGEQQLGRVPGRHRRRGVDEERDRDVLLLDEELDEQLLEPGVDVPVELAQVVAEGVVAVVGELDRLAALDAPPAALEPAADRRAHQQQQALELAQEGLVEDGRVDLARQERLARAGRRPLPGSGRPGTGTGCPSLGRRGRSRRYSTVGATTASRMARTTASVVMPSASPSKLRMIRWRSDGRATARMSSIETLNRPSSRA